MSTVQNLLIAGRRYSAGEALLQSALERVYGTEDRPRCLCIRGGVEMYVARHGTLMAKRMPGTGHLHHPSCPSFEADYSQSGLGAQIGQTVLQHENDEVDIRVDFPLNRGMPRGARAEEAEEPAAIKSPPAAMSMRGLLHFLFEQGGFNKWYPAMEGRRNQRTLRKYLMEASSRITIKSSHLSQRLFIPEPYVAEQHEQIVRRRREQLAFMNKRGVTEGAGGSLALILGEFKESQAGHTGRRVVLKHLPDLPLMIREPAWKKLVRRYSAYFSTREADTQNNMRLMLFALVQAENEHLLFIDMACLMLTTVNWVPIEGAHEVPLLARLTAEHRSFIKPLRYDAPTTGQFPNALLLDTGARPTALHIVSGFASTVEAAAKERALSADPDAWTWRTDDPMQALPPPWQRPYRMAGNGNAEDPRAPVTGTQSRAAPGGVATERDQSQTPMQGRKSELQEPPPQGVDRQQAEAPYSEQTDSRKFDASLQDAAQMHPNEQRSGCRDG